MSLIRKTKTDLKCLENLGVDIQKPKDAEVSEEVLKSYVGKYEFISKFYITITQRRKTTIFTGHRTTKISNFFLRQKSYSTYKVVDAKIEFIKDKSDKVNSLVLYQGGREMPGKRVE